MVHDEVRWKRVLSSPLIKLDDFHFTLSQQNQIAPRNVFTITRHHLHILFTLFHHFHLRVLHKLRDRVGSANRQRRREYTLTAGDTERVFSVLSCLCRRAELWSTGHCVDMSLAHSIHNDESRVAVKHWAVILRGSVLYGFVDMCHCRQSYAERSSTVREDDETFASVNVSGFSLILHVWKNTTLKYQGW